MTIKEIETELIALKLRNKAKDSAKEWETTWTRRIAVAVFAYFIALLFFYTANVNRPYIDAFVPTGGFVLSTLSMGIVKKFWARRK